MGVCESSTRMPEPYLSKSTMAFLASVPPTLYLAVLVIIVSAIWSLTDRSKGRRLRRPPGPLRVPILGNILHMMPAVMDPSKFNSQASLFFSNFLTFLSFKPAYILLHQLTNKYGPIMSFQFGVNNAIVIGSSKYAREVFCREEFANRFTDGWMLERSFKKQLGLIFHNGERYKKIKNFTVRNLKDFGFGRQQSMEAAVEEELLDFLHIFNEKVEKQNNVLLMEHMFTLPVLNILWNMVGGMRFSYDDKKLQRLIRDVEELSRSFDIGGNILMAFPFLRHFAPNVTGHAYQMKLYSKLREYFREILHERQREGSYIGNPKDFIDIFLQQMDKSSKSVSAPPAPAPNNDTNNNNNDEDEKMTDKIPAAEVENLFTEEQFIMVCLDLFTAGSETTANTLDFAILFMILNPDVQEKVQQEIDEVIGGNRLPCMEDRPKMPYTEATLLEVQRMANVIPLVHRVATRDTTVGGFSVKKDDVMLMNLHSIHTDEEMWENPTRFDPSRFLDSNGALVHSPAFLPFGMGKRVCIGEVLAKLTLFTYFTAVLQRYKFAKSDNHPAPSLKPAKGFTIGPSYFYASVLPRTT